MTSQQTNTGNNYIMPIVLLLISGFVINYALFNDDDKNLKENLATVQTEAAAVTADESVIASKTTPEKIMINHENVTVQSIAPIEPAQVEPVQAKTNTIQELNVEDVNLPNDTAETLIDQTEEAAEIIETGVTSSSTALAENVAQEIFEVNTTATKEDTQTNGDSTTADPAVTEEAVTDQEVASQQSLPKEINIQKTDPAIPADEDQSESMPAATASDTSTTAETNTTETKTDTATEVVVDTAIQNPTQTSEQVTNSQPETPKLLVGSSLEQPILKKLPEETVESVSPNEPVSKALVSKTMVTNKNDNSLDTNSAISKPTFITPDENKLIFISPAEENPYAEKNDTVTQHRYPSNYPAPAQNYQHPNYAPTQNQYQQYLYEEQQKQQYYDAMQRQQAQLRAQQQAYQNEMQARQQRYLTEMKAKQGQQNKAPFTEPTLKNQLDADKRIKQIQKKISQLNEEIRQLRLKSDTTLKSDPATNQNTTPASKQM